MRLLQSFLPALLLGASVCQAKSSGWNFIDGKIGVHHMGKFEGGYKDKISDQAPLAKPVVLKPSEHLVITLNVTENKKPAKPHQAFLHLQCEDTRLDFSFILSVSRSGFGKVDFAHRDMPNQLLASSKPLKATLILAGFGETPGLKKHVFDLEIKMPQPMFLESTLRYGKLPEIHHIFKADPKSGPVIVSIFFVLAVVGTLPLLFGSWIFLNANLDHMSKAMATAPISHALFYGSIVAMEGIFLLYYYSWSLFKMLPFAAAVGIVAFVSGSKALSEVQARRMAGQR